VGLREIIHAHRDRYAPIKSERCPVCQTAELMYSTSRRQDYALTTDKDGNAIPENGRYYSLQEVREHDFRRVRCLRCMTEFDRTSAIPEKLVPKEESK